MAELNENERVIREKRAKVWEGVKALAERMDGGEDLTESEYIEFDNRSAEMDKLNKQLDNVMKTREMESGYNEVAENRGISGDQNLSEMEQYAEAYRTWFRSGGKIDELGSDTRSMLTRGAHTSYAEMEGGSNLRAQLDSASLQTIPGQGGYMIPQGFWQNLQIAMKAYGGVLPLCNIVKTASGNEMPWPTSNPTGVMGSYITEANQVSFTDFTFGQGILYAWTITSGVILASFQLLNDSAFSVDSFVTDRMGEAIGRKVAAELWSGAGSASKALTGLTTAITANGGAGSGPGYVQAAAGEQVNTLAHPAQASPTATLAGGLVSWNSFLKLIAGVDPAYRVANKCHFVMNDATVQNARSLTDGFGHPLWEPNTQAGQPDVILGYPVVVDNNAPSVSTSASTPGGVLFGDLKTAFVVRQVDMAGTMRLNERYADYLQVGYLGYVRMDSQPNDLRAVSAYESGAS